MIIKYKMLTEEYPQEMEYLAAKRPLLSAPGAKINEIYYTRLNSQVDLVEFTCSQGRVRQSLPNQQFGASSQIVVPIGSFIGQTYLHLEIPAGSITANQTLCRGWGLASIAQISYLFGNSNISQLTLNKQQIMQLLLSQCETSDKASEMFRLAGDEVLGSASIPSNSILAADILLPFPWSDIRGKAAKMFDTSLCNSGITITVQFDQPSAFIGGSDALSFSAFSVAEIEYRTGNLSNQDLSLRNQLMANPTLSSNYPFIYPQPFVSATFAGSLKSTNNLVTVPLQAFINADITGIFFSVVQSNYLMKNGSSSPSCFNYDPITDVQVTLNGQYIYYAPYAQYRLINMQSMVGASYFHNSVISAGGTAPFNSAPVDSYPVFIDFSRIRAAAFDGQIQNTMRIPQQTMSIQFYTSTTNNYSLFATYCYNAVAEVTNGETRVYN